MLKLLRIVADELGVFKFRAIEMVERLFSNTKIEFNKNITILNHILAIYILQRYFSMDRNIFHRVFLFFGNAVQSKAITTPIPARHIP